VSRFGSPAAPLSDAAAGHFAATVFYRLWTAPRCYEIDTRIGQSDFGNYPSGTIQQFTPQDQTVLQSEIGQILGTLKLDRASTSVSFPS